MANFILKSTERFPESNHFGKSYSITNTLFPKKVSNRVIRIKELFLKPSMGILPTHSQGVDIITIPLSGALQQSTNAGETNIFSEGEVHFLQSGKGIRHYKFNKSIHKSLKCLEIQIQNQKNITQAFRNCIIKLKEQENFLQVLHPNDEDMSSLDYSIYKGKFRKNYTQKYSLKNAKYNSVLLYVIQGNVLVKKNANLYENDTILIVDFYDDFSIKSLTDSEYILIEFFTYTD